MGLLQETAEPSLATSQVEWLKSPRQIADEKSGVLLGTNGTTNFGIIKGGTVLGQITTGKKLRPCGNTTAGVTAAAVSWVVTNSANFRVGDVVKAVSTLGVQSTGELTAVTAAPDDIELFSVINDGYAHVVTLDATNVTSSTTIRSLTWAGTIGDSVATIDVALRATAGPAIVATCEELIAAINTSGIVYAAIKAADTITNVLDDATITATLAGGLAVGGNLDATEAVTAIPDATHLTTATAITTVAGDNIYVLDGSGTPVGIQDASVDTYSHRTTAGVETHSDQPVKYLLGNVRATSANLIGYDATFMASTFSDLGIRVE